MSNENNQNSTKRKNAYGEIKSSRLKIGAFYSNDPLDLHTLLEVLKSSEISNELIFAGINRAKEVLYRDIRNINPTGLCYCTGDDVIVRNKVSSNINIFARILEYLTAQCTSSRTILVCFSDESLNCLFNLLKSEDETERKFVSQTIKNIFDKKVLCREINRLIENEFQMFFTELRTHVGMDNLLSLFEYTSLKNCTKKDSNHQDITNYESTNYDCNYQDSTYYDCNYQDSTFYNSNDLTNAYVQIILFFIKKAQIEHYDNLETIVLNFCTGNLRRSKLTLGFIIHIFEDVTYLRRVVLAEIIAGLFVLWRDHLKEFVINLTDLINSALSSGHHLLVEEVIGFFEIKEMYDLIQEQVENFLPLIFDKLYEMSKKYWRKRGKAKVFKNISLILNMSHSVFEKCLVDYNKRRYGENEKKTEIIDVVEKCLEYSELEKINEEKFNQKMGR